MFRARRILSLAAVLFTLLAKCAFGADDSFPPAPATNPSPPTVIFSLAATSAPSGGTFDVVADFRIPDGVKLYRDKLKFVDAQLDGARFQNLVLPPAQSVADQFSEGKIVPVYTDSVRIAMRFVALGSAGAKASVAGSLQHESCTDEICFLPQKAPFQFEIAVAERTAPPGVPCCPRENGAGGSVAKLGSTRPALWRVLFAFLVGLGLAFSPCVYPTIPIVAAVIGARRERGFASALSASLLYVLGLSLVYATVGLLVGKGGSEVRAFLESAYVRVPIAALFAVLALALFAGWNLALPVGFASRLQQGLAGGRGALRTVALGGVSALVIGPCVTAPLSGLLVYVAKEAGPVLGFWMLFALGWGMGLPLVAFGTATGLLPKAGPWMQWVKTLLGFVLLWAGLYFLRPVVGDAVYRATFALLLVVAAVFLGGLDIVDKKSSFGDRVKKVLGVVAIAYALFLAASAADLFRSRGPVESSPEVTAPNVFRPATTREVEDALAAGKRVILDFYTKDCASCKRLDAEVFSRPEAINAMRSISNLMAFKINAMEETRLADAHRVNIKGVPTVVFIDTAGNPRDDLTFSGTVTLDEFIRKIEAFKQ